MSHEVTRQEVMHQATSLLAYLPNRVVGKSSFQVNADLVLPDLIFNFLRERNIISRNSPHKIHIWVEEHDMKVLDSIDALQRTPILEPDHILTPTNTTEGLADKVVNLLPSFRRQITRWI